MHYEMKMPDLSTTDSEVRIVRWLIEPGQTVQRGQPLLEVETDKATMEVESVASGVLREVRSPADEAVAVGQVIAVLEVEDAAGGAPLQGSNAGHDQSPNTACEQAVAHGGGGMFARNRAAAAAQAAVPNPAVPNPAASPGAIPLSLAERVAAQRTQQSKQTIPHYYLQTSVNASAMIARRKEAEPLKLAWDAFMVWAVARAMARFERFRCRFDGDHLTPIEGDAIGVAVEHNNETYVVPITSPATKTVVQISADIRRSAELVRSDPAARRIQPTLLTVTNLGVCQIEAFIPIITPPEAAVLGVGRVMPTPVAKADGRIEVEPRCWLSLSVDHRIAAGKYAGDFLAMVVRELESI